MIEQDTCRNCRRFVYAPQDLEWALPGLNILSSAFGSVRADSGLCKATDTLTPPRTACSHFLAEEPASAKPSA